MQRSAISIRISIETFQEFWNHQQDNFNLFNKQDFINILKKLQSEKADGSGIFQRTLIKTPDGFT